SLGEGIMMVEIVLRDGEESTFEGERLLTFSEAFACPHCNLSFEELEPRTFSFNSPYGACPDCLGLGTRHEFDVRLVIPDERLSLENGAIAPWRRIPSGYKKAVLRGLADALDFDINTPFEDLTASQKKAVLHGTGTRKIDVSYTNMHGRRRKY